MPSYWCAAATGRAKSTLLVALKDRLDSRAFYWPTSDKLAFEFSGADVNPSLDEGDGEAVASSFSSGERQLKSPQEIASRTHAKVYLLDEWDTNLDAKNRASAEALVAQLAARGQGVGCIEHSKEFQKDGCPLTVIALTKTGSRRRR